VFPWVGAMTRKWAPPTRYTLRRNTASVMKGFVYALVVDMYKI